MSNNFTRGKLFIIGAGPGDPELLTVKATRYLAGADVVLTDRLVSNAILKNCVSKKAEIVFVGKQCSKGISTPQQTINELILHYCFLDKTVVRLKGGDVSVFSNILDELETAVNNHIPYEIIPGITAASGAAAYTGIPLTARGYATSVRFLTYYKSGMVSEDYWKELSATNDTLVFYMSSETLDTLVEKLVANNIHEDKLMAIIEQATTPLQRVHVHNLYNYKNKNTGKKYISPSLVIIGKVVALREQFAWLTNSNKNECYFNDIQINRVYFKLSPVGEDTNRGGPPWAVSPPPTSSTAMNAISNRYPYKQLH
ncbi:MAG TPA: uroporphyrinogen-III C-methyltransferase [Chitinophagaceae bacterium]|nr:uroporphyrinogen-III C-methyltransferase [Chitinophagaceae bacterium]